MEPRNYNKLKAYNLKLINLLLFLIPNTFLYGDETDNTIDPELNQIKYIDIISPYNYLQNPFALTTGNSHAESTTGTFNLGISSTTKSASNYLGTNPEGIGYTAEIWGQSSRMAGFAFGGAFTIANIGTSYLLNPENAASQYSTLTNRIATPSQAYINYQYSNKFDISVGNIILNTPWTPSALSAPDFLNSTYQGIVFNYQPFNSLLFSGYNIYSFQMYPNNFWTQTTFYNGANSLFANTNAFNLHTPGSSALGTQFMPTKNYNLNLWLYQFTDYINMIYGDTNYKIILGTSTSMELAAQGLSQNAQGTNIISQQTLVNGAAAGSPQGNAIGAKWVLNVPHDSITIAYNQVFGNQNSFLGGGIITPYTYSYEFDPLYTTVASSSLAELGAGNAYLLQNRMQFLDSKLEVITRVSWYNIQQVYDTQSSFTREWDGILGYNIPRLKLYFQGRLVYLEQPVVAGGNSAQIRFFTSWLY